MPLRFIAAFACLLISCGGSSFSSAIGGNPDGGDAASAADGSSSGGGDTASEGSGGGDDGGASDTGKPDGSGESSSGGGGDATSVEASPAEGGPVCADISGGYGQITATGLGCGNLNTLATECIMLAQEICAFQLTSAATALPPAVNGLVILQSDGSISNADLQLGTTQRMGCIGQWAPGTQTLTLDCGGKGTGQSCVVSMVREVPTCK